MAFFNQPDEDRAVKKNRNIILNSSRGSASSRSIEEKNDFDFLRDVRCLPLGIASGKSAILRDSCHSAACYRRGLLQITATLSIWKFRKNTGLRDRE